MGALNKQPVLGAIHKIIWPIAGVRRFIIAYSGGIDSHVLLHATHHVASHLVPNTPILAIHINHQLQTQSVQWKHHCAITCRGLGVAFVGIDIDALPRTGQSPEEAARDARYRAIASQLCVGDVVLTAHHRHDQAETVLLQLLRGSGAAGLAAMALQGTLGKGIHLRPFLDLPRQALRDYAKANQLNWIEDPSNQAFQYRRNYLRYAIWPLIETHWPNADATLARVASHSAETAKLNAGLATLDSEQVVEQDNRIALSRLGKLNLLRQKNVLRHWLKKTSGRFPSHRTLQALLHTVIYAKEDAKPLVQHGSLTVRRYRQHLYAVPLLPQLPTDWSIVWENKQQPLEIAELELILPVAVLSSINTQQRIEIKLRQGGEVIKIAGRGSKLLKTLLQESGIPPWERYRSALVYAGSVLIAVYVNPDLIFFNAIEN